MNPIQVSELLLQSLEHERGGVKIYKAAIACVQRPDLKQEWMRYLAQTEQHVVALTSVCEAFEIDPRTMTPGAKIVRENGKALLFAIESAHAAGNIQSAQIVAAECVVLAETKDHLDWELLAEVGRNSSGRQQQVLVAACEAIESEEDEHLYNTRAWVRELWFEALGLPAALPPADEKFEVTSAAEAQLAEASSQSRH
jgi:hypothetical protein